MVVNGVTVRGVMSSFFGSQYGVQTENILSHFQGVPLSYYSPNSRIFGSHNYEPKVVDKIEVHGPEAVVHFKNQYGVLDDDNPKSISIGQIISISDTCIVGKSSSGIHYLRHIK